MCYSRKVNFMDEQTIKVLARFTEIGQLWPEGAWIYITSDVVTANGITYIWFKTYKSACARQNDEISELEANQKGIFRDPNRLSSYSTEIKELTDNYCQLPVKSRA